MKHLLHTLEEAKDIAQVGGKALALGRMLRSGFPVPSGFVITTASGRTLDAALQAYILQHFDALDAEVVAVRSSAVGEDSGQAAWAGQLETFLNTPRHELLSNIERCFASMESDRAQAYAAQQALPATKVAVVIQKMIQSDVSGVAFSVHPISQAPDQLVIEAGLGLGEAIVSGQVTPDTYVVSKQQGGILDRYIARQTQKLARTAAGDTTWQPLSQPGTTQKLTDRQILELSEIVCQLEAFFCYPVDVEWALHEGTFYILQSRPITTLT